MAKQKMNFKNVSWPAHKSKIIQRFKHLNIISLKLVLEIQKVSQLGIIVSAQAKFASKRFTIIFFDNILKFQRN